MGEISLDGSSVNRFISSLSKSIQALCHGCMDFDESIQMIGYININIDSGKVVQCVLNENVRKSGENSMTCSSDSFQAKKEKVVKTKDSFCSPIPLKELNPVHASPNKRLYSTDNNHQNSAKKRFRHHNTPSQVHRPPSNQFAPKSGVSEYGQSYNNPTAATDAVFPSNSSLSEPHHQSSSIPSQSQFSNDELPSIKTEADNNSQSHDLVNTPSDLLPSVSFKTESTDSNTANNAESFEPNSQTDSLSNNVQQPSTSTSGQESFVSNFEEQDSYTPHSASFNQQNEGCDLGAQNEESLTGDNDFDVIEIGDDDEDVEDLMSHTGEDKSNEPLTLGGSIKVNNVDPGSFDVTNFERNDYSQTQSQSGSGGKFVCSLCQECCPSKMWYVRHLRQNHPKCLPYCCDQCEKRFMSKMGLLHHKRTHTVGRTFECDVCQQRFYQKSHMVSHRKRKHNCPCHDK